MYIIGIVLIVLGLFAIISGIIGLFRFPDFYTKIHASGLIESCGIPMTLVGLACLQGQCSYILKLIIISLLFLLLNPVSTHILGKAALISKTKSRIK